MSGRDVSCHIDCSTAFVVCLSSLGQIPAKHVKLEKGLYLPHLFQFIIHRSIYVGRVAQSVYLLSYGVDGPGIEFRWGEIFRTCPDRPWGPPSLLYNGYRLYPEGKVRPGIDADPSPPSSAAVMEE